LVSVSRTFQRATFPKHCVTCLLQSVQLWSEWKWTNLYSKCKWWTKDKNQNFPIDNLNETKDFKMERSSFQKIRLVHKVVPVLCTLAIFAIAGFLKVDVNADPGGGWVKLKMDLLTAWPTLLVKHNTWQGKAVFGLVQVFGSNANGLVNWI
jgi:hypothetical protein